MCGRSPEKLFVPHRDEDVLRASARNSSLPWFQVQRARIVLAIAACAKLEGKWERAYSPRSPGLKSRASGHSRTQRQDKWLW